MRKRTPIHEQLKAARIARGFNLPLAAGRTGLEIEQIENLESGGANFTTAQAYALGLGKRLVIKDFFPRSKGGSSEGLWELWKNMEHALSYNTVVECYRVACSPMNIEKDVRLASLDHFLSAHDSRAHLTLENA